MSGPSIARGSILAYRVYDAGEEIALDLAEKRFPDAKRVVLQLVGRAYELLKGEVEVSRNQLLEVTVIVLIMIELVQALRH